MQQNSTVCCWGLMAGSVVAASEALNDEVKLKNLEEACPECTLVAHDLL
ncbi:hypothetical protein [Xenorhabdus lircayensis]|nr:hypothetical protein [Xenorhabdus lircayensis]